MKCPKCDHEFPQEEGKCVYCGFKAGIPPSTDAANTRDGTKMVSSSSDRGGAYESLEGPKPDNRFNEIPEDLRMTIAQLLQFSPRGTRRKRGKSPVVLTLIFLASAGVTGFILWLIM